MGLKEWLERRTRQERLEEDINAMDSRAHSRAYHRFFAGYTEVKKVKEGGLGYTIERVYTGQVYERRGGKKKAAVRKALYTALLLAAAGAFCLAAIARVETNSAWYVILPQAVSAVLTVWAGVGLVNTLLAPEKMTFYEYRSSSLTLRRASLGDSAALLVTGGVSLAFALVKRPAEMEKILRCAAAYLIGAAAMLTLNRLESHAVYDRRASEMNGRVNGVEIQ